jgi:hypothetical protein
MNDKVKVFIGSSSNGEDAPIEATYEYSLRKNASRELEIEFMRQGMNDFYSDWQDLNWSTPFSGFRWAIPERCEFKGKAIYTDCDMINFKDICELHDLDMEGKPVLARRGIRFGGHEFCVMLIDCVMMKSFMIPVRRQKLFAETHHRFIAMFSGNSQLVGDLDPRWNCLDGEQRDVDDIWQLHYTNMATQPWQPEWYTGLPQPHPRNDIVEIFYKMKEEASEAGFLEENYKPQQTDYRYGIIGR